jgi:hypothetical protein
VARRKIDTGVVTHKWSGAPGPNGTPVHWWLTWDGGSADANSKALIIQPGDVAVKSPAGTTPSPDMRESLKISPCKYNFAKLKACLTREANNLAAKGGYFGMCWMLPPYLIEKCTKESDGCTVSP